jgi:hypothetical protein
MKAVRALLALSLIGVACGGTARRGSRAGDGSAGTGGATSTGGEGGDAPTVTGGAAGLEPSLRVTGSIDTFGSGRVANGEHVLTRQTLLLYLRACGERYCTTGGIRP